jgi:DNA mismatch repair protein MutS
MTSVEPSRSRVTVSSSDGCQVSVLFDVAVDRSHAQQAPLPSYFTDFNLDQIVDALSALGSEHDLKAFFCYPLTRVDAVQYRHEVFQDLHSPELLLSIRSFAERMHDVRGHLMRAGKLRDHHHKEAWFLHAAQAYCAAVIAFAAELASVSLRSRALCDFRHYLLRYAEGHPFVALSADTKGLGVDLSAVRYSVLIKANRFSVRNYDDESDYSAEIEETFARFAQGGVKDYRAKFEPSPDLNHIEAKILEFVAQLNPVLFDRLDRYCTENHDFIDATIATFDREIHFYITYIDHVAELQRAGLRFCYPRVSTTSKESRNREGFDLALAKKLVDANAAVVCNDFSLRGKERIIVITGPNQGGKTTFARSFGQLHYLAALGCPVPGCEAELFLFDRLFAHFERQERVENLRGKLEDDLVRIHSILERATPNSIVVMNEVFTSTTLQDEAFLSQRVMERLVELDCLCVWVTFVEELASYAEQTVSMASTVVANNPTVRTFKIVRQPADGLAYAMAIAEKYGLTFERVKERIGP